MEPRRRSSSDSSSPVPLRSQSTEGTRRKSAASYSKRAARTDKVSLKTVPRNGPLDPRLGRRRVPAYLTQISVSWLHGLNSLSTARRRSRFASFRGLGGDRRAQIPLDSSRLVSAAGGLFAAIDVGGAGFLSSANERGLGQQSGLVTPRAKPNGNGSPRRVWLSPARNWPTLAGWISFRLS